ncbi:MAG: calcium/sodium antiporter [candidate division WOR-3 bacterium]|nr:MAG: calcium/sodium antiporter [candidate division WOR-3 bacterium]
MPPLVIWIIVFVASLYILIRASEYFTEAAEHIGLAYGISDFIVGVTIVAVGTSLPEIVSSLFAVARNSSEIVIGNVIGSNIANIFLVFGIAAVVSKKLKIKYELLHIDLPLLMGSALFLAITIWDGTFTLFEALLALVGVVIYLLHAVSERKRRIDIEVKKELLLKEKPKKVGTKTLLTLIISGLLMYIGGRYTIEAVIGLSMMLNIGKEVIAASAVAFGTSLPELAVTITAARKGKPEIAVGNVLGSNVFNALAVMGIPTLISTITIPQSIIFFGLPMMLIATLLFFFMTQDKEITLWEGWLLIIFYVFFIGKLFNVS